MSEQEPANAIDLYQPGDRLGLALGRLAAERVDADTVRVFQSYVETSLARHGENHHLRQWLEIVGGGPTAVKAALTEVTERGQVLRTVISFRAFVKLDERNVLVRQHVRSDKLIPQS